MARRSISWSPWIDDAAELLRKKKGRTYRTLSEYIAALVRYDGMSQREHSLTAEWAALTGYESDRLDQGILALVQEGQGTKGSWLTHEIERIIERMLATNTVPTPEAVKTELARAVVKKLDPSAKI